ncbi:MAG: hypothetical protein FJW27_02335 [Acidimicrobiia bacterium]|nr:hypothetical protein [Acidimicrobiia bacterium]
MVRLSLASGIVFIGMLLLPPSASAWGFAAHQFIMRRAIDLLPAEIKPFFEQRREEVVVRVKDPDLWRTAGWPDDPNHFMDFGAKEYGDYPFTALPRDHTKALAKFGQATLTRNGRLPWRFAEVFGSLRRGFEGFARNSPFAADEVVLFSGVAAHYIQDAHQPLHASDNYDGQLTGQRGIHARFEIDLFERAHATLTFTSPPVTPIRDPEEFAWTVLLDSYQQVDSLLRADRAASRGLEFYDDRYYQQLLEATTPLLTRQISRAIAATAATISGAWVEAGRPAVGPLRPRSPQRIDRGRQEK